MGCCQNFNSILEEEISSEPLSSNEGKINSLNFSETKHKSRTSSINPNISREIAYNQYKIIRKIASSPNFERFLCLHIPSQTYQEVYVLKSTNFEKSWFRNLPNFLEIILSFPHENIVKIHQYSVNQTDISIYTEVCNGSTLTKTIRSNKIPFRPAIELSNQIIQALIHIKKIGLNVKYITENDIFLVKNTLKVNFSAIIEKKQEFSIKHFEEIPSPEVFSFGLILLKLLNSPYQLHSIDEGIQRLAGFKIDPHDISNLKNMLKISTTRPSLIEVSQFHWNTSQNFFTKLQKNLNEIDKISEEQSNSVDSCGVGDGQECVEKQSKCEKSEVLPTMESLTNN